jgi:RNA polymerase sigma-70 factor (ECF subfamily)
MVGEARGGNIRAFEGLIRRHHRRIFNLLYGIVGEEEDAADLTQETFIRAYRALPGLKSVEGFHFWLNRVAVNAALDHLRSRKRKGGLARANVDSVNEDPAVAGPSPLPGPEANVESGEIQGLVRAAVLGLPDHHRAVVTLHHLQGLGVEEISKLLNCSVGTVKSRLARARARLHRRLRPLLHPE